MRSSEENLFLRLLFDPGRRPRVEGRDAFRPDAPASAAARNAGQGKRGATRTHAQPPLGGEHGEDGEHWTLTGVSTVALAPHARAAGSALPGFQPHARPAPVLCDELRTSSFQGGADRCHGAALGFAFASFKAVQRSHGHAARG